MQKRKCKIIMMKNSRQKNIANFLQLFVFSFCRMIILLFFINIVINPGDLRSSTCRISSSHKSSFNRQCGWFVIYAKLFFYYFLKATTIVPGNGSNRCGTKGIIRYLSAALFLPLRKSDADSANSRIMNMIISDGLLTGSQTCPGGVALHFFPAPAGSGSETWRPSHCSPWSNLANNWIPPSDDETNGTNGSAVDLIDV